MSEPTENEKQLERMKRTMLDSAVTSLSNDIRASAHIGLGIYLAGVEIADALRDNSSHAAAAAAMFYGPSEPAKKSPGRPKKSEEE